MSVVTAEPAVGKGFCENLTSNLMNIERGQARLPDLRDFHG